MKTPGLIAALAALALASCQKKPIADTAPEAPPEIPAPAAPATPPPLAPSTPPPSLAAVTPAPATPAPRLAPEGVFYLVAAYRAETATGLTGLPPGTGVKRVRPGVYLTPAGEIALPEQLLTNDMDLARQARDADLTAQAVLRSQSSADAAIASRDAAATDNQGARARDAVLGQMATRDHDAYVGALVQQETALRARLTELHHKNSKEHRDKADKGYVITATTEADIRQTEAALKAVSAQIRDAKKKK